MQVRGPALEGNDGKGTFTRSRFLSEAAFEAPGRQMDGEERKSWNVASSGYEWEDNPDEVQPSELIITAGYLCLLDARHCAETFYVCHFIYSS